MLYVGIDVIVLMLSGVLGGAAHSLFKWYLQGATEYEIADTMFDAMIVIVTMVICYLIFCKVTGF